MSLSAATASPRPMAATSTWVASAVASSFIRVQKCGTTKATSTSITTQSALPRIATGAKIRRKPMPHADMAIT